MRITRFLVMVVTAACLSAFAATAPASGATAARTAVPHATFYAVSCARASFCLAVGKHTGRSGASRALAEEWNGKAWRVLKDPPGQLLYAVSCPSASFCLASGSLAGGSTLMETWNGRAWRMHPPPPYPMSGITCGSARQCMIVSGINGDQSRILHWTGNGWHTSAGDACTFAKLCSISDVSCSSASSCMETGTAGADDGGGLGGMTAIWDGRGWNLSGTPPNPVGPVTCSRKGFSCMTVDEFGAVAAFSASQGWRDATPGAVCGNCRVGPPFSCGSLNFCTVVNRFSWTALDWNGSTWKVVKLARVPRMSHDLSDVSCATRWACMAVGGYFTKTKSWVLAERWNGTSWQLTNVNGQVAVPAGGQLKVPTPRVDQGLIAGVPPRARASRMR
jgi:hypothetical protein